MGISLNSNITLEDARKSLAHKGGFAYDIICDILDPTAPHMPSGRKRARVEETTLRDHDADSLFRTLVLDEGWNVEDARAVYVAAMDLIGRL